MYIIYVVVVGWWGGSCNKVAGVGGVQFCPYKAQVLKSLR